MAETSLREVLADCRKSAETGYQIASSQSNNLKETLKTAKARVEHAVMDFKSSPCYEPETESLLESQITDINSALNRLSFAFTEDLNNLKMNLSEFSITLFGRTMAGKSTLMEILTEGDGSSIGKGAQRTTRDIRTYHWNGLRITDVPGIGAFEGEDDEQIAFEAAKQADLILFLLTDDAPQAEDAEAFGRIVELGKPILGIMNVKMAVQEHKSLRYNLNRISAQFDGDRLCQIHNQFMQFSGQYGQDWSRIPFVFVHLQAAYLSQNAGDETTEKSLHDVSRIDDLKNRIIGQVREKGKYFRIKTFIDSISIPVLESMESLLEQSQANMMQGRTISFKKRQLSAWRERFHGDGKAQIRSLIIEIRSELYGEIALFAEEHFEDNNAGREWEKILKNRGIESRCRNLLDSLELKCNDKLKEISREISKELQYISSLSQDSHLNMSKIIDGRKLVGWSSVLGAAVIAALGFAKVISWPALALPAAAIGGLAALGSLIFKNRTKMEREARANLEQRLRKNIDELCITLQSQMEKTLEDLVGIKIDGAIAEIGKINVVVFSLALIQQNLAWELNTHLLELNGRLMEGAIRLIGAEGLQYHVREVARIPGNCLILLNEGTVFPPMQMDALRQLMSEELGVVYDHDNKKVLISRVLRQGIDRTQIRMDDKAGTAHIPLENVTPVLKCRIRLAQQLTQTLIVNQ